ncbi:MAG: PEP-CTERM sorting domain-containing protein [Nitrosospira sp.]|nr:PEP-CTERM sorting domain-containing protein [Nitrosospira sp.]
MTCSPESPCITDADISGTGLGAISYLRITAAGNSAQGWPEAYTLDAVEALNFRAFQVYEPGTLALLAAAALALALVRHRKS